MQVVTGNHLLGVTSEGKLIQPAPSTLSVSADELKVFGFIAAAAAFVLLQYMMLTTARTPSRKQVSFAPCLVEWNQYAE